MEPSSPLPIVQDSAANNLLLLLRPASSFSSPSANKSPTAVDTSPGSPAFQPPLSYSSSSGRIREARTPDEARTLLDNSLNDLINQVLEGHSVVAVPLPSYSKLQTSQAHHASLSDANCKNGSSHVFPFQRNQIISRAVEILFDQLKASTSSSTQFTTSVTHAKVCNQELTDLNLSLSSSDDVFFYQKPFEPNQDLSKLPWPGLKQIPINHASEALELLEQGNHSQHATSENSTLSNPPKSHAIFCITLNQHKLPNIAYRPNTGSSTRKFRSHISRAMSISSSNLNHSAQTVTITSTLQFLDLAYNVNQDPSASLARQIKEELPNSVHTDMHLLAKLVAALGKQPGSKSSSNNTPHDCTKFNGVLRNFRRKKALGAVLSLPCSGERQLNEMFISLQENHFREQSQAIVLQNIAPPTATEVLEQVAFLQATIGKLREELSRVRDSTSITDLSNSRISLSSVETELSCELKPNMKSRKVSRHLTQIQGCYSRAFSDIFQAVSRQPNSLSDRQSIQSVCEQKINPIVKEYENSILALELDLAIIRNPVTPKNPIPIEEAEELGNNIRPSPEYQRFRPSSSTPQDHSFQEFSEKPTQGQTSHEGVHTAPQLDQLVGPPAEAHASDLEIQKTGDNEENRENLQKLESALEKCPLENDKILEEKRVSETNFDKATGINLKHCARLEVASGSAKSGTQEHPIDPEEVSLSANQTPVSQHASRPASEASSNYVDIQSESRNSQECDSKLMKDFRKLQTRHRAVVDELDQVRAQYIHTLKELEEATTHRDETRTTQRSSPALQNRRPSLPTSISYIPSTSSSLMSFPSSPALSTRTKIQGLPYIGGISPRLDPRTKLDLYEGSQGLHAEGDDLLETLDTHDDDHQQYRNHDDDAENGIKGLEGSSTRIMITNRNYSRLPRRQVKRSNSNSGLSTLQPLKLPLMRSLSLSSPQLSCFEELWKSPASRAFYSPHSDFALPVAAHSPFNITEPQASQAYEQSYLSLEKEVIKLQEALKEREEEIQMLESKIRLVPQSISSVFFSLANPLAREDNDRTANHMTKIMQSTSKRDPSDADRDGDRGRRSQDDVPDIRSYCKRSSYGTNESENERIDNIESLNLLMRSMAKKESNFLELIESLTSQLQITKRQHDDLVKLSSDQVINMSSEIEGLRKQLASSETSEHQVSSDHLKIGIDNTPNSSSQINDPNGIAQLLVERLDGKRNSEDEFKLIKAQEELALENLKTQQAMNIKQVILATNDAIENKDEEVKQIELRWQAKLESELIAQANFIWAEVDAQQSKSLKARVQLSWISASRAQRKIFDEEISTLVEQHTQALARSKEEMETNLKTAETDFVKRNQELQATHANEINQLKSTLASALRRHEQHKSSGLTSKGIAIQNDVGTGSKSKTVLEDRISALEQDKLHLINQYESQIEALKEEHESKLSQIEVDHKQALVGSLSDLDQRRSRMFEAQLKKKEDYHHSQLAKLELKFQKHQVATHHQSVPRSSMFASIEQTADLQSYPIPSMSATTETWPSEPQDDPDQTINKTESTHSVPGDPYLTTDNPPGLNIKVVRARALYSFHSISPTQSNFSVPDSPTGSVGPSSTINSMILDPHIVRKIQTQESHIAKLSQDIVHCEAKLKKNILVVSQLELALEASERNLKKTRNHMSGWVQERDKSSLQNENLRNQLAAANSEIERLKKILAENSGELERKLGQTSALNRRESALKQLDARINELSKGQGKRSKFNCF